VRGGREGKGRKESDGGLKLDNGLRAWTLSVRKNRKVKKIINK